MTIEIKKTRLKVLIVDDTPENLDILLEALGDTYAVVAARDGEKALKLAGQKIPPDIILLDIMMPGIDGYEVCRRLKGNPATRDIPVIFLTALTGEGDEVTGLSEGAVDYVHKPISVPLVQLRVANHLELAMAKKTLAAQVNELKDAALLRDDVENITRHDLKGPLSPIISYPDLLLKNPALSDMERSLLETIRSSGFKVLDMINRSLDLFKMESGTYTYHPEAQNLAEIIEKSIAELNGWARGCKVEIDAHLPEIWVTVEEPLCLPLFSNLLKNAIEATPRDGKVQVWLTKQEPFSVIQIHNPGVVPQEIRDHFFKKYSTAGKNGGTGLGTYSAQLMVYTMHGEITMESDEEQGTRITVKLPLKHEINKLKPADDLEVTT